MIRLIKLFGVLCFIIFGISSVNWAEAGQEQVYRLSNGLEVVLLPGSQSSVVSVTAYVRVGSASERLGEYGLAHFLEHMLFKGTTSRGPGAIALEVESFGGRINANTGQDETVFQVDAPGDHSLKALEILADLLFHPRFDPAEFEREKSVVIEEIKRVGDSPDQKLVDAVMAEAYQVHPYRRSIGGTTEGIAVMAREKAVDFHKRWYQPGNIVLVAAGDFDPQEMARFIDRTFGRQPAGPVPFDQRPGEPEQEDLRTVVVRSQAGEARVELAFHVPAFRSDEAVMVDLLAEVLGRGQSSRLAELVGRDEALIRSAGAASYTPRDPGLFLVSSSVDPERARPALQALMTEMQALAFTDVSARELDRAKLKLKAEYIRMRSTVSGEARSAAYDQAMSGDTGGPAAYFALLDRVSAEDLRRAAAKYFRPQNLTVGLLLPENAGPESMEWQIRAAVQAVIYEAKNRTRVPAREDSGTPAPVEFDWPVSREGQGTVRESEPIKYRLSNGVTLIVKPDRSWPLVSIRAAFPGGLCLETEENNGITNLFVQVWERGVRDTQAEKTSGVLDDAAGRLQGISGENTFGFEAEFLTPFLDQGLEVLCGMFTQSRFDPKEVEKVRRLVLAELGRQENQPTPRALTLMSRALYGEHPYSRSVQGRVDSVSRITVRMIEDYYRSWVRPTHLVLSVVGDVDPEAVRDRLEKLLAGWTGAPRRMPEAGRPFINAGKRIEEPSVGRSQSQLIMGFLAPGLEGKGRYTLEVLQSVLSGTSGRLFASLRERRGLVYNVTAFYRPGLATGSFGVFASCDPGKVEEVRALILRELEGLAQTPVGSEELARAKAYRLGVFRMAHQTYRVQASDLALGELYGLGIDYNREYLDGVSAVTAEDIMAAARQYLDTTLAVNVTVGPLPDRSKPTYH